MRIGNIQNALSFKSIKFKFLPEMKYYKDTSKMAGITTAMLRTAGKKNFIVDSYVKDGHSIIYLKDEDDDTEVARHDLNKECGNAISVYQKLSAELSKYVANIEQDKIKKP